MKLAVSYSGYLPGEKYGGPVSSLFNLTELLGGEVQIYIICCDHDFKDPTPYRDVHEGWNRVGKAQVMYLPDAEFTSERYREILSGLKPDAVYISSIFSASTNLPLLRAARKLRLPVLLAPRGELNPDALGRKAAKKKAYLLYLKLTGLLRRVSFQATSDGEKKDIQRALRVSPDRVYMIPNVPALPEPKLRSTKRAGEVNLCFSGRLVENKNLHVAIGACLMAKEKVTLDIYGANEDAAYWERCRALMEKAPQNVHIEYKGAVAPSRMRQLYGEYDALISPTQFENYGQSIAEAMLHDVPVIISRGTTPWDEVESASCGWTVPLDEPEGFTAAIDSLARMDQAAYEALLERLRRYCSGRFDYAALKSQYLAAFEQVGRIK